MVSQKNSGILSLCFLMLSGPAFAASTATHTHANHSHATQSSITSDTVTPSDNTIGFDVGPGIGSENISVPTGVEANKSSSRTRPMLGVYFEHEFTPNFAIRPELDYVQRGFSTSDGAGANGMVSDIAANYLELPVLFKGQLPVGQFTPYVATGPFIGFLMDKGQTITQGGKSNDISLDNVVNSFNFGWDFALGSTVQLTRKMSLELALRYSMGLTNILTNPPEGESVKLNSFQILTGLAFAI